MKIIPGTYAVFWKHDRATRVAFHADVTADSARDAARIFAAYFPRDRIVSVRARDGRFCAFA
jgi:hypothetical protein